MKFKVGDRVRIRKDLEIDETYGENIFVEEMKYLWGEVVTISKVCEAGQYRLVEDETGCCWTDEMLEPVTPDDMPDDVIESLVTTAFEEPDDPKIALHKQITEELTAIYEAKNHDYGDSFQETYRKLGLISAVTRITDKVNRLQSLSTKEQRVADESIVDTLKDCANYCIMTIIAMEVEDNA